MLTRRNDDELISAYIDGQLDDYSRQAFETRLGVETDLRRRVEATRRLVRVARQAPLVQPPRNFTLARDTGMARAQPTRARTRAAWRFASALATLVFVILIGLDIGGAGRTMSPAAPQTLIANAPAAGQPAPTAVSQADSQAISQYAAIPTVEPTQSGEGQSAAAQATPQARIQAAVAATVTQPPAAAAAPLAVEAPTASPHPPDVRLAPAETQSAKAAPEATVTQPQRLALAVRPTSSPAPEIVTPAPSVQPSVAEQAQVQAPSPPKSSAPGVDWLGLAGIAALVLAIGFALLGWRSR